MFYLLFKYFELLLSGNNIFWIEIHLLQFISPCKRIKWKKVNPASITKIPEKRENEITAC
jgi:hypothetical protein